MSRRRNPVAKNIKDYIVPIIGGVVILLILISIFSGDDNVPEIQTENKVGISVEMDTSNTESFVVYPGEDRVEITDDLLLFKGEEVIVREGSLSLDIPQLGTARLGKLGELTFNEDASFSHNSGKLWVNSIGNIDIQSRFATIKIASNTTISIDQNEMATTVYGLSGTIEVINLAGENTILLPNQKITISRLDASNEDLDMKSLREPIDDIFKNDDWYIINNGDRYLNNTEEEEGEGVEVENKLITGGSRVLVFDEIEDEGILSDSSIDISGQFGNNEIAKITLDSSIEGIINLDQKTFIFENVDISSTQNDLVFRALNAEGDILEKRLITLYYNGAEAGATSSGFGTVKTYDNIDASQFTFTEPSRFTTYSTTSPEVTMKGQVFNKDVAFVSINDYRLNSYSQQNGTWRYYAFERFNTISVGTNVYTIKYFDTNNKLIYTNTYTIVRKDPNQKITQIISDEA